MLTADVIAKVKAWRGPVKVTCIGRNDVFHVEVIKKDLLFELKHIADGEVEYSHKHGTLYIDSATS